jgi:hypothetical protein
MKINERTQEEFMDEFNIISKLITKFGEGSKEKESLNNLLSQIRKELHGFESDYYQVKLPWTMIVKIFYGK